MLRKTIFTLNKKSRTNISERELKPKFFEEVKTSQPMRGRQDKLRVNLLVKAFN